MPIIKSAKKAARQATKRNAQNAQIKKSIKVALKNYKANPTTENLSKIQSEYDKAVKKGLLKKNTASRRKSALYRFGKEAGLKLVAGAEKSATKVATTKKTASKTTSVKTATKKTAAKKTTTKKAGAKTTATKSKAAKKSE